MRTLPLLLFAGMAALVAAEIGWRVWVARKGYDGVGAAATLGVAGLGFFFDIVNALAIGAVYALVWSVAPLRWPLGDWRTWVLGFFAVEFAS